MTIDSPWNDVSEPLGWQGCVYHAKEHWFYFITSTIIKYHSQIQVNILYKETDSKQLHQRNLIIFRKFRKGVMRYTHSEECNISFYIVQLSVHILHIFEDK